MKNQIPEFNHELPGTCEMKKAEFVVKVNQIPFHKESGLPVTWHHYIRHMIPAGLKWTIAPLRSDEDTAFLLSTGRTMACKNQVNSSFHFFLLVFELM